MAQETSNASSTLGKRVCLSNTDYTIACLVPLGIELAPVRAMLDAIHDNQPTSCGYNAYTLGSLGEHNIVIAPLPSIGNNDSGIVANQLMNDFPSIQVGLLVGIAGGIPDVNKPDDIRLGDVIVSEPSGTYGGVVQFDKGKRHTGNKFQITGHVNKPPPVLSAAVKKLKAQHLQNGHRLQYLVTDMLNRNPKMKDVYYYPGQENDFLFESDYDHVGGDSCEDCDFSKTHKRSARRNDRTEIHYGTIGSSNAVIRDATERDNLRRHHNILSVEMEAAGVMDTLPCLVVRGICDYADSHKNKAWQPYSAAVAAAYMKELLQMMPAHRSRNTDQDMMHQGSVSACVHQNGVREELSSTHEQAERRFDALHRFLAFPRMDARFRSIAEALPSTCEWLLSHEDFQRWVRKDNFPAHFGFFWIKGKPGSGKSTLMKSALQWATRHWRNDVIISYFFNARANDELEKSSLGFYRALTYQVLHAYSHLQDLFVDHFQSKVIDGVVDAWSMLELKAFLSTSVRHLRGQPLNLFVDALDEGDEDDIRQMVMFLEDLVASAESYGFALKVCLSSRHFPHISIRKGLSLVMEHQMGHENDIRKYIQTKLICSGEAETMQLCDEIYTKSASIFLWIVLVIPILNRAFDTGQSVGFMRECLDRLPKELDDLFERILAQSGENIQDCLSLFQWVLFSRRALSPIELDLALKSSLPTPQYNDAKTSVERFILNTSRGLTEITNSEPPFVQFIHETVRDFLERKGLLKMDNSLAANVAGFSHEKLKLGCLNYIKSYAGETPDFPATTKRRWARLVRHLPFLEYSVYNLLKHADLAEGCGLSQRQFLSELEVADRATLRLWIQARNALQPNRIRIYSMDVDILYILAGLSLENLTKVLIDEGKSVNVKGERFGSALQAACATGSEPIVLRLIDAGADYNAECGEFKHVLFTTAHYKQDAILNILTRYRLKSNKDLVEKRLQKCIARRYPKGVEAMLKMGANPNGINEHSHSLLMSAAMNNDVESCRQLIKYGARNKINGAADVGSGSPLDFACMHDLVGLAQVLIEGAIDVKTEGGSQLSRAIAEGQTELAKVLIKSGADVNTQVRGYENALTASLDYNHLEVSDLLIEYGANVNPRVNRYQSTPLYSACRDGKVILIDRLLRAGADMYAVEGCNGSPLQGAVSSGNEAAVECLLSNGCDINFQLRGSGTALHTACREGAVDMARLLIERGADVNLGDYAGFTAYYRICTYPVSVREQLKALLIQAGASLPPPPPPLDLDF